MSLFSKIAADGASVTASKRGLSRSALSEEEHERFDKLEEDLPLQTIVMFRTMARQEVCPNTMYA